MTDAGIPKLTVKADGGFDALARKERVMSSGIVKRGTKGR
jgi:hypothetical protein